MKNIGIVMYVGLIRFQYILSYRCDADIRNMAVSNDSVIVKENGLLIKW